MRNKWKSGIYCIHNTMNGKRYIGQSVDFRVRLNAHRWNLNCRSRTNRHIQAAWDLYGESVFEFTLLESVPVSMLDIRECAWIEYYDATNPRKGYNVTEGGQRHHSVSAATRDKISKALTGWKQTKEHKRRISLSHMGHFVSEITRKRIANAIRSSKLRRNVSNCSLKQG